MSAALAAIAPQLGKLVLLLSSSHDGEIVAAARAIDRVLRANGRDWHDFAQALCSADQRDWQDTLAFCAATHPIATTNKRFTRKTHFLIGESPST